MVAIGKKRGPAVGLVFDRPNGLCDHPHSGPIGIDALKRTLGVRGVEDNALASPTAAASGQSDGERLRRATGNRHFLKLPIGEKSDVGAVWRPEWVTRPQI